MAEIFHRQSQLRVFTQAGPGADLLVSHFTLKANSLLSRHGSQNYKPENTFYFLIADNY